MIVKEQFEAHRKSRPNYWLKAGDHRFSCNCMDCVVWLTEGLESFADLNEDDKKALDLVLGANSMTEEALATLRDLFDRNL